MRPTPLDPAEDPQRASVDQVVAYLEREHGRHDHSAWLKRAAELIRESHPRLPLGGETMLQRWFLLPTGGTDKSLDAIGVLVTLLKELDAEERAAALAYLTARFAGEQP